MTTKVSLILLILGASLLRSEQSVTFERPEDGKGNVGYPYNPFEPLQAEQVHLSYWGDPTEMWVTWATITNKTNDGILAQSFVEYGTRGFTQRQEGKLSHFIDGGSEKRWIFVHRAKMTNLEPDKRYMYHVGGPRTGWSDPLFFRSYPAGTKWSPRFAVYGDLGIVLGYSIPPLQSEAAMGHFDAVLHVGDMAYDLAYNNGRFGDVFMRQIQPIAGLVPYMVCPGNHEVNYDWQNYKQRFTMPSNGAPGQENMWWSTKIGPARIISVTTEFFYFTYYGWKRIADQYNWLVKELEDATTEENLRNQPWIVFIGHRPPYCSNNDDPEICEGVNWMRTGLPGINAYGFENLMYKYGVDVAFYGHLHSYERLFPVFNNTVMNGSTADPYHNPGAPVHIVTGVAGNRARTDGFFEHPPAWSAVRNSDYGYGRMIIFNETHLYFEQVSAEKGTVIDRVMIRKDLHGPKAYEKWRKDNNFQGWE